MPSLFPVLTAVLGYTVVKNDQFSNYIKNLKAHVKTINDHLKDKEFLVCNHITSADIVCASSLITVYQTVFDGGFRKGMPHVSAWFQRIISNPAFIKHCGHIKMTEKAMKAFDPAAKSAAAPAKKEEKKDTKPADDDLDLFGDDGEDDGAAAKAAAAAAKAKATPKVKKVVIAQSLVLFEVKPLDDQTDLDVLAARILKLTGDGIYWKSEYKKVPVAYGIFKIIIGVTVEDEKVSVDGLQERIEELDDMVQSVEIMAFNKI
jgi:elongation factor 1-beta